MNRPRRFLRHLLLVGLLLVFCLGGVGFAAMTPSQQTEAVQVLEDTLFAVRYDQEALEARVSRLEQTVFGQAQAGQSLETRITKLKSVLSSESMGPLSPLAKPKPEGKTQAASPGVPQQAGRPAMHPSIQQPEKPLPGETDYPTVSQMELKVFGKTFVQEDITQRLTRLEKQVFKTPQNGPLVNRVDNLRLMVLGDIQSAPPAQHRPQQVAGHSPQPYPPQPNGARYTQIPNPGGGMNVPPPPQAAYSDNNGYSPMPYPANASAGMGGYGQPSPDMLAAMNEIEKEILGQAYPAEPIGTRLDRVETKVFNTTSPELSPEDRMQRVIAVASAGGAPQSTRAKMKSTFQSLLPVILTILPMLLL